MPFRDFFPMKVSMNFNGLDEVPLTPMLDLDAPATIPTRNTGKLPALGWNSWNAYRCEINEEKILQAAQAFASLGLKKAGYEYVNVDDCWSETSRDTSTNRIVPDGQKFPNGIAGVATKVHDLGLKFGIYSDAGLQTCAKYPGSLGFEEVDAQTFAEWGVDYLKYDNCNVPSNWTDSPAPPEGDWFNSNSATRYRTMAEALASQSRPIQFSLCIWGLANVWTWGGRVGHSWRMDFDSEPNWSYLKKIITKNAQYLDYVDFYQHNDMDMMEIGNGRMTIQEERTHFAAWAFMKSPILLGTDLNNLSQDQIDIITNPALLAFSQDEQVGAPAKPFNPSGPASSNAMPEFYAGNSSAGTHVFVINGSDRQANKTVQFGDVPGLLSGGAYRVQDMWKNEDMGVLRGEYSITLDAHDTAAILLLQSH